MVAVGLPQYVLAGIFAGSLLLGWNGGGWTGHAPGVVGILAVVAGVVLLFTGRYPLAVFDLLVGFDRWVLRTVAYAAFLTSEYPPFRLDAGGPEPPPRTPTGVAPAH